MNKIAVYVNTDGITSSIPEQGYLRIYSKVSDHWIVIQEYPCTIDLSSGIAAVRRDLSRLLDLLEDCKVFVATEISGQLYYLLESHGFQSYESSGIPEDYLDSILSNELEELSKRSSYNQEEASDILTKDVNCEGKYFINLRKALAIDPNTSSKKLLRPILQEKNFQILEIFCDHVPRWFETELGTLGLNYTVDKLSENEYRVSITTINSVD